MRLVQITWEDIVSEAGWTALDKSDMQPHVCLSVGYIIGENDKYVTLAATYSEAEDSKETNSRIGIPRGCIQKIVDLVEHEGT